MQHTEADTHGVHSYLLQTDPAHHTLTRTDGSTWTADSTLVTVDKLLLHTIYWLWWLHCTAVQCWRQMGTQMHALHCTVVQCWRQTRVRVAGSQTSALGWGLGTKPRLRFLLLGLSGLR